MRDSLQLSVRSFGINDLELFGRWLEKRHVRDFFGDPQIWIKEVSLNLSRNSDWITYFIVEIDGSPIGFFQYTTINFVFGLTLQIEPWESII
ncbi:hypothetical protein MASR1M31_15860 [Porphyromonadaceae bacterium]